MTAGYGDQQDPIIVADDSPIRPNFIHTDAFPQSLVPANGPPRQINPLSLTAKTPRVSDSPIPIDWSPEDTRGRLLSSVTQNDGQLSNPFQDCTENDTPERARL